MYTGKITLWSIVIFKHYFDIDVLHVIKKYEHKFQQVS